MKVLHTSDLHIGKKLEGRERLEEQKQVLEEIFDIIVSNEIELIICAGDIFDTYNPSAEAEQLFFEYAKKFASDGRAFVIISGNHDDNKRLIATVPLSQELNIFIVGNQKQFFKGCKSNNLHLIESGEGYLIFENNCNEKIFINTLPYPSEYRFKEENKNEDYITQMQRWLNNGHDKNVNKYPEILISHIFTLGGIISSSEREIDLGGAKAFPPKLLPKCDYVALGHLHKFQKVAENVYYSGSIMQYAFDEAGLDKFVITFDISDSINGNRINNFEKHCLKNIKRLARLSANSVLQAEALLAVNSNSYIELTLYTDKPLSHFEYKELTAKYPDIVSIITVINEEKTNKESRKNFNKKEMFVAYYQHKFQKEPSKELLDLYLELMEA